MKNIYGNRNALFLLISQCIAATSDRMLLVGICWFIIQNYSNAVLASFLAIALSPHLLMVLFSGKIINKLTPTKTLAYAELARIAIYLLTIMEASIYHNHFLNILSVGLFFGNVIGAIYNPAVLSMPKLISPDISTQQKVMGLLNSSSSMARLIGPVLAIPLYSLLDIRGIFIFCSIFFIVAWLFELEIKQENTALMDEGFCAAQSKRFFCYLKQYKTIMLLLLMFLVMNIFVVPVQIFMPIIAKNYYQGSMAVLSIFEFSLGLGILFGGIYISFSASAIKLSNNIAIPYLWSSIAYMMFSVAGSFVLVAISLCVFGFFLSIGNVVTLNYFQSNIKSADVSNIMSYVNFISVAAGPIALFLAGYLLKYLNYNLLISMYGLAYLLFSVVIFYNSFCVTKLISPVGAILKDNAINEII